MNYCICSGLAITRKRLKTWFFWPHYENGIIHVSHGTYTHIYSDCESSQPSFSYQKYSVFHIQEKGFAAEKNNYLNDNCDYYLDSNDNICSLDSAQIESVSNDKWQISFLSKQIPSSCGQQCNVRITTCDGALANTFCYKMGVLGVYGEENVFPRLI